MKINKNIIIKGLYIFAILGVLTLSAGGFLVEGQNAFFPPANPIKSDLQENTESLPASRNGEIPFISEIFESEGVSSTATWSEQALEIIFRLFLAVVLAALLAFRPRRTSSLFQRNIHVAQTQILLAAVGAALMMIVGNNAARAFAIFAAVSLVRFRTNIRDPKEIAVLLISLALGLAAGVGRWELSILLCVFVLILLWILEFKESEQVFRSMQLTVKTRNTDITKESLKTIFDKYSLKTELREVNQPDEANQTGSIIYYLSLRLNLSTDNLSEQIVFADSDNIKSIEWKHKRNALNIYQ